MIYKQTKVQNPYSTPDTRSILVDVATPLADSDATVTVVDIEEEEIDW